MKKSVCLERRLVVAGGTSPASKRREHYFPGVAGAGEAAGTFVLLGSRMDQRFSTSLVITKTINRITTTKPTCWMRSRKVVEIVIPTTASKPSINSRKIAPPSSTGIGSRLKTPRFRLRKPRMLNTPSQPRRETEVDTAE